jgi:serine/threonine protein kinase
MNASKRRRLETATSGYSEIRRVGEGAVGVVYEVEDDSKTKFAAKIIRPERLGTGIRKRLKNEVAFCQRTSHRNVVKVIDHGVVMEGNVPVPFFIMPLYASTLRDSMRKGIAKEQVLRLFSQLLDGVETAHLVGVWHRDLKPENILFDPEGDGTLVVADFGIAHFQEDALITSVDTAPGDRLANFEYAAPEQKRKGAQVDHRADLFALGLMLNEMFTGVVPHGSGYQKVASASPEFAFVDEVVDRLIRQTPSDRPTNIDAVKQLLLGLHQDFFNRQRLSRLDNTVIAETTDDSPEAVNPTKIIGFDYNARSSSLIFKLSRIPSPIWIQCFHDPQSGHGMILGRGPSSFEFNGDSASVLAAVHEVDQIARFAREYVNLANRRYAHVRQEAIETKRQAQRAALQRSIEEEKTRLRVVGSLQRYLGENS